MRQIQYMLTDASNTQGQKGRVYWTSIKFRASAMICHISQEKVKGKFVNLIHTDRKTVCNLLMFLI